MEFNEKDPVLDRALELLTGKVSLEEAKKQAAKESMERKVKEQNPGKDSTQQAPEKTEEK